MLRSVLVKASVVASVAVVGGGGVALAASTGHLSGTHAPDTHGSAQATHAATGHAHAAAGGQGSGPATTGTHGADASHTAPSGSPSPNMRGLCTAFKAHAGDNPGKAMENPAFKALIARAGGKDNVTAYCAAVLSTPAGKASSHAGDASTHASTHAPSNPSSHAPTTQPTRPQPSHSTPSHPAPSAGSTHRP